MVKERDTVAGVATNESVEERAGDEETSSTASRSNDVTRRSFLSLFGLSVTPIAAGTVEAAQSGYGAGGYGEARYGAERDDGQDPALSVITDPATYVTEASATLTAEVTALGDADTVDVSFEIRRAGTNTWYTAGRERLTTVERFDEPIDGLESDTDYEYRAVAETADARETGDVVAFTTDPTPNDVEPVIETFATTETEATDARAELTVDWAVTHEHGALDTVRITVYDEHGIPIAGPEIQVSGASAADTDVITVPSGTGVEYLVTLVVVDSYGNVTTDRELLDTER